MKSASPEAYPLLTRLTVVASVLLGLATIAAAYLGRAFITPIVAALFLNLLLTPVVRMMVRRGVPCSLAAGIVLLGVIGVLSVATVQLAGPALDFAETAPERFTEAEEKLRSFLGPVREVQEAVDALASDEEQDEVQVTTTPPLSSRLVTGLGDRLIGVGAALVLLFFLLASGDQLLRKTVAGLSTFKARRRAVRIHREIERDISRYLMARSAVNAGLGIAVAVSMWLLSLPNPLLWGTVAAVLNFIPYVGALVGMVLIGVVSLGTYETLGAAAAPPLVYFVLTTVEAQLLSPFVMGKSFSMSPIAVFVAVFFWGSLWGVVGALLAIPILTTVAIVSRHVDALRPLHAMLR